MKFSMRKGVFETNSSSNHSLILTNKRNMKKDEDAYLNPKDELFAPFILCSHKLETVKDKAIFLAALMGYDAKQFGVCDAEYKMLMTILQEHNEEAILKEIEENAQYEENHGEPFCANFYYHGVLADCTCDLRGALDKYFNIKKTPVSLDAPEFSWEAFLDEARKNEEERKKTLGELKGKIEEFLYGDGIVITYDEI